MPSNVCVRVTVDGASGVRSRTGAAGAAGAGGRRHNGGSCGQRASPSYSWGRIPAAARATLVSNASERLFWTSRVASTSGRWATRVAPAINRFHLLFMRLPFDRSFVACCDAA